MHVYNEFMSILTRRLLPVLALLLAAQSVRAQQITSPYRFLDTKQEAGPFVSYVWPAKGSLGLGATKGPAYGGRYGMRLSSALTIQVEGFYFPTERVVLDSVVVDSAFQRITTAKQNFAVATGALRFNITGSRSWHRLQPFVILGGGAVMETSTDEDETDKAPNEARLDFGTSFAGALGAGIAWLPSARLAVRVDGRNVLWKLNTPDALARQNIGRTIPTDEWVQNITVSAGVSILF
jgi:hypothetical protein